MTYTPSGTAAVTRQEIEEAARRIAGRVRVTPVLSMGPGAWGLGSELFLKLELMQHTGSFKLRGAFNRLLQHPIPPAGVIAASGGNHGAAVAYAARSLGVPAEIFVPATTPVVKVDRLRLYGAQVNLNSVLYAEALTASNERAEQTGALIAHAYDQPEIVAGQGTVGRELEEGIPALDTVLVPVGGGGLIAGIAAWFGGRTRVIGVEPEGASTMAQALEVGYAVDIVPHSVAQDSLGASRVGAIPLAIAKRYVERVVLVPDDAIKAAQQTLWNDARIAVEPGAATSLTALLSGAYQPVAGERIAVVLTGGNVDLKSVALGT